ncbi:MAG TPA: hotdog fold domain-containing protein [Blastocatellia bacterium]
MTSECKEVEPLPVYRVMARNTSADSENRMHDDTTAAQYGFRGGLVPGVTIYAYMTVPVVHRLGRDWLERGSMKVRFLQPFYDREPLVVRADATSEAGLVHISVRAERESGELCATAEANLSGGRNDLPSPIYIQQIEQDVTLPAPGDRPAAAPDFFKPGTIFGALKEKVDLQAIGASLLSQIEERLPVYYGSEAVVHPITLLSLCNRILMENRKLGPWIHTGSDLLNCGAVHDGETVTVRGLVHDCFERKGHEFVVLDLVLSSGNRVVQKVRHTAIYKPRKPN